MFQAMLDAGEPLEDLPEVAEDELRDTGRDDQRDVWCDNKDDELHDDCYNDSGVVWKKVQNNDRIDDKCTPSTTYRGLLPFVKIPLFPKAPAGTPTVAECDTSGISAFEDASAVADSGDNASQYTNGR